MIGRLRMVGMGAAYLAMLGVVPVTAQQAAVEQGLRGSSVPAAAGVTGQEATAAAIPANPYTPPACVPGVPFADITCTTGFDPWIEQFGKDGITAGCGGGNYCPGTTVTRAQMAVLVEKAMRGTANWPPHTVLVFHHQAAEANSDVNSGTELLSLVAAIPSTGSEAPSASNPWLIKVGPGIYDLGSGSLTLPVYTALEGAGQDITIITGTGYAHLTYGTVIMGDHSKLSHLSVKSSADNATGVAVYLPMSLGTNVALEQVSLTVSSPSNSRGYAYCLIAAAYTSFSMIDCDVTAHGAFANIGISTEGGSSDASLLDGTRISVFGSVGQSIGLICGGNTMVITNSRFEVSDGEYPGGVEVVAGAGSSTFELRNSEVRVSGQGVGVYVNGVPAATLEGDLIIAQGYGIQMGNALSLDISSCRIEGTTGWIYNSNQDAGRTVTVGASKLVGTTVTNGGPVNCFGNYTNSAFLANTCP